MIVTRLTGGLGNQMFQYAAGLALARRNNDALWLDTTGFPKQSERRETEREYALSDFKISSEVLNDVDAQRKRNPFGPISRGTRYLSRKVFRLYYHDWHPEILKRRGNVYLEGYFQSEKYFFDFADVVRREFALGDPDPIEDLRLVIARCGGTPVSLHVRRGDYVNDPKNAVRFNVCSPEYFAKAAQRIQAQAADMKLVVFSDDVEWVRENMPMTEGALFISGRPDANGNPLRPSDEMTLMAACQHHIISNSTFSWWGAYLNPRTDKIVVAPQRWNNSPEFHHRNIAPEGWLRVSA